MAPEREAREGSGAQACIRLERMRAALDKFLTLVDEKASARSFAVALPGVSEIDLEKTRLQFAQDLKTAIRDDFEDLVVKYNLQARLSELQELVDEADERQKHDYAPHSAELKDVWRPDLNISAAICARVKADQSNLIPSLEQELAEVSANADGQLQASNKDSFERIAATEQATEEAQAAMADVFGMLDKLRYTVTDCSESEASALQTMIQSLYSEIGPV
ncbi:tyrosinase [Malassezia psittaci]|uniref:Tyrosinase n=1 Tax=Malassezia psittaci TaxID=1821823 RepID=A0AAF0F2P1_9BASI|nr:tyrosinase [Malassezia psittaci]